MRTSSVVGLEQLPMENSVWTCVFVYVLSMHVDQIHIAHICGRFSVHVLECISVMYVLCTCMFIGMLLSTHVICICMYMYVHVLSLFVWRGEGYSETGSNSKPS